MVKGFKNDLHTYHGTIDLDDLGEGPHIHFNEKKGIDYVVDSNEGIFLKDVMGDAKYAEKISPIYTLGGLYHSLPNNRMNTRIEALKDTLFAHARYEFDSIAKRKETVLKLLEHKYREFVSDQGRCVEC
ncbi:MAG: hypothetical protein V1660_01455 [archaeon]